jgi:hypothetical protein
MHWDDDYAMQEYCSPSWDVWNELAEVVGLWYETYREHWGVDGCNQPDYLSDSQWAERKNAHSFAAKLLRIALALNVFEIVKDKEGPPFTERDLKQLRSIFRDLGRSTQIKDRIGLDLASEALSQLKGATERSVRLLGVLRAQRMSVKAALFIARATRLYIWGFEPETAIMCRAALEAALAERLYELYDADSEPPSLDALITLAGEHGILEGYESNPQARKGWRARNGSPLWRAQRLKWSGNYAAHDEPILGAEASHLPDAFNVIREFSKVVGDLFPPTEDQNG